MVKRLFKFRVWGKDELEEKYKMFYDDEEILVPYHIGLFGDLNNKDFITMQYTGLKDCKGKEIYEGDILSYKNFTTPKHKGVWHVEWNAYFWDVIRHFAPRYEGDKGEGWFEGQDFFWKNHEYMEIIGNIYENPELVKDVI